MPHRLDRPIQLRLLGDFDVTVGNRSGRPAIRYLKPKLLLAMLALAQGKALTRVELAERLWPDDVKDGRNNLRHALFVLRRVLDPVPHAWSTTGNTLALNPDTIMVDALAVMAAPGYESLSLAHRLSYDRGRFLEYADLPDNAAFTAWKTNWQFHIERDIAECRSTLVANLLAGGHLDQALDITKQWIQRRPEDESAHRQLIQLLLNSQDFEAARLAYQHCANIMRQSFDTEPSASTRALIERGASIGPIGNSHHVSVSGRRPLAVLAAVLSHEDDGEIHSNSLVHDLRDVRHRLQHLARRHGAYVLNGADDSLIMVYGYPQLTERPAHFATTLALAMQAIDLPAGIGLNMGIHAGTVPGQSGRWPEEGTIINQQAMRLAYLSHAGEILVSTSASERLARHYVFRHDSRHGRSLQRLIGPQDTKSIGRMFGRVREFDSLVRLWARLPVASPPTVMTLRGAAGLGKSLLSRVMSAYVQHTGGIVRALCTDETHRHTPLYSVIDHVMQKLALPWDPSPASCNTSDHAAQIADTISERLVLDVPARDALYRVLCPDTPYDQGRHHCDEPAPDALINALAGFLTDRDEPNCPQRVRPQQGRPQPVRPLLLVWEDIHWMDASSLLLLDALIKRPQSSPMMVLLTSREEFETTWPAHELLLKPLERQAIAELVAYRSKGTGVPAKLRARIVKESDGVPLYAEEMVRQAQKGADIAATPLIVDLMAARGFSLEAGQSPPKSSKSLDQSAFDPVDTQACQVASD